jgi:exopolyphosphatase/guanosine-5'-triphosphate,3'-diphosphate pyrophosphatase
MNTKAAVIDMGTNTFHLLVAEKRSDGTWKTLCRERRYVKLAEKGIEHIGAAPFERAVQAMLFFRETIDAQAVPLSEVRAVGTAALRTAHNAGDLLDAMQLACGIRGEVIGGLREAELICKGVRQAVPWPAGRGLIMDIGGGSTEFIVANSEQVLWQHSFPLGASVLLNRFRPDDPITTLQIAEIVQFLSGQLTPLWTALSAHPTHTLVGASGTFDVIDQFLLDPATKPENYGFVPVEAFSGLSQQFVHSTRAERLAMPGLPEERVDMIVPAMLLIDVVLQQADIQHIYTSAYALKEGLMAELLS